MKSSPKNQIKTEKQLAEQVIEYFKNHQIYKEVLFKRNSKRIDIIAVKDNIFIGLEIKKALNVKLIEQTAFWKLHTHKTYLCIPSKKNNTKYKNQFIYEMLQDYGIGIIFIYSEGVCIISESSFNSTPDLPVLYESQKETELISNDYITPFKNTIKNIEDYLQTNGRTEIFELINNIQHHYANKNSAKSQILKMINWDVIKTVVYEKEDKKYYIILR